MSIIAICSSASFYEQVNEVADQLSAMGHEPLVPRIATIMKQSGDYNVSHYKTWFDNESDYVKKANLMRTHFDEVAKSDMVLVANYQKYGQANYIGGNVLMEMAVAFYLNKPIYILNEVPEDSSFEEEIKGFMPVILQGQIDKIG